MEISASERVLFAAPATDVRGTRLASLVGGYLYVTSHFLIYTPNYLAYVVGRRSWKVPIEHITNAGRETRTFGRALGTMDVVAITLSHPQESKARFKTLLFPRPEQNEELLQAIEKARYWH